MGKYQGAYWSLTSGVRLAAGAPVGMYAGYSQGLADDVLGRIRTDLDAFSEAEMSLLEDHGYWAAERSTRRYAPALSGRAARPPRRPIPSGRTRRGSAGRSGKAIGGLAQAAIQMMQLMCKLGSPPPVSARAEMKQTTTLRVPIVAGPYTNDGVRFIAALSLAPLDAGPVWFALCRSDLAEPSLAARMLALLALQQDFPLLHPTRTPTAPLPASAFFLPDGYWSDHRNLDIPPQVRAEVDRLADTLGARHPDYVHHFTDALSGRRPRPFAPVPKEMGIADPNDDYTLVPPPPIVEVDLEALGEWGTEDLFQSLAATDYRSERYLESVPDEQLTERAVDALVNMYDFEGPHTIITNLSDTGVSEAVVRMGEVMEEIRLRRGSLPPDWMRSLAPRWRLPTDSSSTRRALEWITAHQSLAIDGLAKFTRLEYARAALANGRIRLAPASEYQDPSLNRAQRADELSFAHELDVKRVKVALLSEDRSTKLADLSPLTLSVAKRLATNVYVYCTSMRISARLFHDFCANACLVIRDRASFMRRLAKATTTILPGWQLLSFNVTYVDPYDKAARHSRPLFTKPIKYQYQREHRIVWLPPTKHEILPPLFLELGSIADIAEIIDVSTNAAS